MSGFGTDLQPKKITGKIYHSCTLGGLCDLIENLDPQQTINFSTEETRHLFGRECVLILKVQEKTGQYTWDDADAGKNFGWDEFRCSFESWTEIDAKIDAIVMADATYQKLLLAEEIDGDEIDDEIKGVYKIFEDFALFGYIKVTEDKFYNF